MLDAGGSLPGIQRLVSSIQPPATSIQHPVPSTQYPPYTKIVITPPPPQLPPLPPPAVRMPEGRRSRIGVWASLILHVVVILLLVVITRGANWWEPLPLDGTGLDQAGGGGGAGRQITMIPLAPAAAAVRVVRETPTVVPPPVPPAPVITPDVIPPPQPAPPPADTIAKPAAGAATTGSGGGTGGGSGTGTGPGAGPGTGSGTGGTGTGPGDTLRTAGTPPEPRQVILPPFDYPKAMRGRTIQVTFFVLADGRVDHVVFGEDLPDRGYAKKLEDTMRAYRFRPARSPQGVPIPGHTTVSISF